MISEKFIKFGVKICGHFKVFIKNNTINWSLKIVKTWGEVAKFISGDHGGKLSKKCLLLISILHFRSSVWIKMESFYETNFNDGDFVLKSISLYNKYNFEIEFLRLCNFEINEGYLKYILVAPRSYETRQTVTVFKSTYFVF